MTPPKNYLPAGLPSPVSEPDGLSAPYWAGLQTERLLVQRRAFVADATRLPERQAALAGHLMSVLAQLAPERLGVYWSVQSEFDATAVCLGDEALEGTPLALPFSFRHPVHKSGRAHV